LAEQGDSVNILNPDPRGFALWRMPGESNYFFTGGSWKPGRKFDPNEIDSAGFFFHPFDLENSDCFLLQNETGIGSLSREETIQFGKMGLDAELALDFPKQFDWLDNEQRKSAFQELVGKAISVIQDGVFEKLVCSRVEVLDKKVNPWNLVTQLGDGHPNAFVSFVSIEGLGQWIGATPELLLRTEKERGLKTMSLAGTRKREDFSDKEENEQGIVTDYIESTLKEFEVENLEKTGPEMVEAGNVHHLKTSFSGKLPAHSDLQSLVYRLHPTPAVAGIPKKESLSFISKNENHPRSFYSGFLGPVLSPEVFSFFVNLRCLQVFKEKVVLYSEPGSQKIPDLRKS